MGNALDSTLCALGKLGVAVVTCDFAHNDCISMECGKLVAYNPERLKTQAQRRTALMHEHGHFLSGAFYHPYSPYQIKAQAEHKAVKASIIEYIPLSDIYDCFLNGLTELWQLADHFDVTEDFMQMAIDFYKDQELTCI